MLLAGSLPDLDADGSRYSTRPARLVRWRVYLHLFDVNLWEHICARSLDFVQDSSFTRAGRQILHKAPSSVNVKAIYICM